MRELLTEKYRPKNIEEYIFQTDEIKNRVQKWLKEQEIPHIVLSSRNPGSGKTSLSRILVKELGISPVDVKYINATLLNGIGFIREELEPWLKKASMSKFKIVQMEEADKLTPAAQLALRDILETYSAKTRFIFTCNYVNKLDPALLSRTQHIEFNEVSDEAILEMVVCIVEGEGLTFDDEQDLLSHIDAYKPDMRKIINSIDEHTFDKKVSCLKETVSSNSHGEWADAWGSDDVSLSNLLKLTHLVDHNNFEEFYEVAYNNAARLNDTMAYRCVILCSEYLYRASMCANQKIHLEAFLYRLFLTED